MESISVGIVFIFLPGCQSMTSLTNIPKQVAAVSMCMLGFTPAAWNHLSGPFHQACAVVDARSILLDIGNHIICQLSVAEESRIICFSFGVVFYLNVTYH